MCICDTPEEAREFLTHVFFLSRLSDTLQKQKTKQKNKQTKKKTVSNEKKLKNICNKTALICRSPYNKIQPA